MNRKIITASVVSFFLLGTACQKKQDTTAESPFRKDNLLGWCVNVYDAKNRNPGERAQLLKKLGITRYAVNWRQQHVPEFDEEVDALRKHGIEIVAYYLRSRTREPLKEENVQIILDLLERRNIQCQLWMILNMNNLSDKTEEYWVEEAADILLPVAHKAKELGCTIGLYNHGGWFGEPENQLAILDRLNALGADNTGIVYNFHHGHEHIDRFQEFFPKILPHLICLDLNGMKKGGPKILPLNEGDHELAMLRFVMESGYSGPVGILDHQAEKDAEQSLTENLTGLQVLLKQLGDEDALQTYR